MSTLVYTLPRPLITSSPNACVLSSNERHAFQDLMERNSWTLSEDPLGSDGALGSTAALRMKVFAQHKGLQAQTASLSPPSETLSAELQWF